MLILSYRDVNTLLYDINNNTDIHFLPQISIFSFLIL